MMKDDKLWVGDGRMAAGLKSPSLELMRRVEEQTRFKKEYIAYIYRGFYLDTKTAEWLRERAGLAT